MIRALRFATLLLMALSLLAVMARPDLLPALGRWLFWVVPLWIVFLYLAQAMTTPRMDGSTPWEDLKSRLAGRTWTCPRCGRELPLHVPICGDCGELRPEPSDSGPEA